MQLTKIFRGFFHSEKTAGYILIFVTVLSILLANIFIGPSFPEFFHQKIGFANNFIDLNLTVEHWINDGLMTIFFLMVGLEIERELYVGELSSFKNALLPVLAAIGGMAIPALIHYGFNAGLPTQSGFGIPMATDIAFALGILALAGNKVPASLKIFLTALAIIDDLGAITVIAIFYTADLSFTYLLSAFGIFAVLFLLGKMKVNNLLVYLLGGLIMWYCMLQSGVHATIAGVLLAFAIPFNRKDPENISYRLQHFLHTPVAFIILPIFALANTAILLPADILGSISTSNSLGIILGLLAGKTIGILGISFLATKVGWAKLPLHVSWKLLFGAAILAGIGFTMSIFITNLAFNDADVITNSKMSILLASLIAAIAGLTILRSCKKNIALEEH
jgi:NhaA family Na+:H+ antiporter